MSFNNYSAKLISASFSWASNHPETWDDSFRSFMEKKNLRLRWALDNQLPKKGISIFIRLTLQNSLRYHFFRWFPRRFWQNLISLRFACFFLTLHCHRNMNVPSLCLYIYIGGILLYYYMFYIYIVTVFYSCYILWVCVGSGSSVLKNYQLNNTRMADFLFGSLSSIRRTRKRASHMGCFTNPHEVDIF